jgi:hypothetical protein
MKLHPLHIVALSAAVVVSACNSSETTPSTPSKPAATASNTPALPAGHPPIDSSATKLPAGHPPIDMSMQSLPAGAMAEAKNPQWTVPADWKQGKTSSIRRGSFLVSGADNQSADISVTAFPGDVGGMVANINRWRGQIGLDPVSEDEAKKLATTVDCNGISATVVDFTGTTQRMVVATISQGGNSWFIKMTGDPAVVAGQKDAFLKFVQSVKF